MKGRDDKLVQVKPLLKRVGRWRRFLREPLDDATVGTLQKHERTGRSLGGDTLPDTLERRLYRSPRPERPGPKPRKPVRKPVG